MAVAWAWTQKVAPAAAILLQALADESDDLGICGVHDVRVLARKCGLPERTAYRELGFLKSSGRLLVHQRWSDQGLQIQSRFELNLDRPADTQQTSRRKTRIADLAGPGSDSSANLAGLPLAGSASLAERTTDDPAKLAVPASHPQKGLVVDRLKPRKQQQNHRPLADLMQVHDAKLISEMHKEMGIGYTQLEALCERHSNEHLRGAMDQVSARRKAGEIRNPAGYFLTVVRAAPPGSLLPKPSMLDLTAPAEEMTEAQIAAGVAEAAKRDASQQQKRQAEGEWNALSALEQTALRIQFMAHLAVDNHVVYASLLRKRDPVDGLAKRLLVDWWVARDRGPKLLRIAAGVDRE